MTSQIELKDHDFSCQNCDEPFTIMLPEEANTTSYTSVCEEEDVKRHNLKHIFQCQKYRNIIYYCADEHEYPLVAIED
jgi:hypothetical protein